MNWVDEFDRRNDEITNLKEKLRQHEEANKAQADIIIRQDREMAAWEQIALGYAKLVKVYQQYDVKQKF